MAGVIRFDRARLLALVRAGAHDQAVTEAVGCSLTWAQKVRQAAGLKANRPPLTAERRGRLRELFEQVRAKHGVPHLRALDTGTAPTLSASWTQDDNGDDSTNTNLKELTISAHMYPALP